MSSSGMQPIPTKGPYLPGNAGLGRTPTRTPDIPISSVFLVLFIALAATHMTILQVNLRRGHKFIISGLCFGFCMARIVTLTMRLVWTTNPKSIPIAIAAQVFVSAGVVLLFIVNIIFAQRIIRAQHPLIGWHKAANLGVTAFYASIVVMLIALITCTVQSFYTLSRNTRRIDRDVQLVGATYFAFSAFFPTIMIIVGLIIPRKGRAEKFGTGRLRTKMYIVLIASLLLTFGAAFRAGTAYVPRPRNNPAWYHDKGCFYFFNFTIEVLVVLLYAVTRIDLRFHVPNGSSKPGDYIRQPEKTEEQAIVEEEVGK
ncbi:MAG: hypothetical protein M1814_003269 [Vezdaea aestivalis]|nr:MAG: hypothetical protein M1814_003269 [Vezdaea aestivalis]